MRYNNNKINKGGEKMEKYLEIVGTLILIFGLLIGVIITVSELDYNFQGVGFTIIGISLITFGFLNGLAQIIDLLKEINKKLEKKG